MSDGIATGTLPPPTGGGQFEIDTSGIDSGGGGGGGLGGNRSQRERIMIAVLVAALVVGGGFFVFKKLHKSTPAASTATTVTTPPSISPGTGVSPGQSGTSGTSTGSGTSPTGAAPIQALAPYQVYTSRDPFVPVALPIGTGAVTLFGQALSVTTTTLAPITVPTLPSSATTTTFATALTTLPPNVTTTTGGGPAPPPPSTTHVIELISVYTSNGQPTGNVTVDGQSYTVYDGTTFASNFTVVILDVTTGCGTFLYADYEFQLCSGQQATV